MKPLCLLSLAVLAKVGAQDVTSNAATANETATCLPDGIPAGDRKALRLTNENLTLGIWNLNAASGQPDAPTAIFYILASEKLGYQVELMGDKLAPDSVAALNNVAGCHRGESEWVCDDRATRTHAVIGINLALAERAEFDRLQADRSGGRLEDLAGMGFVIQFGMYVKASTAAKALADRVFLDDYRSYNASQQDYFQLFRFFSPPYSIREGLVPCNEWLQTVYEQGVHDLVLPEPRCVREWWPSPSCTSFGRFDRCIPLLSHRKEGLVESATTLMHQASILNMPVALAVADGYYVGSDFYQVVSTYDVLYFYWEPDVTFREFNPVRVALPIAFGADSVPQHQFIEPRTVISTELNWLAPDARALMGNMQFSEEDIHTMMSYTDNQEMAQNSTEADVPHFQAQAPNQWLAGDALAGACRWIQSNAETWLRWIPTKLNCFPGQGLYSIVLGQWVLLPSNADECRVCEPGSFSSQIESGDTAVCRPCGPGTIQPRFGGEVCQLCQPGTFAANQGTTTCTKCWQGSYQDGFGASECKRCPEDKTTLQGSSQASDCVCGSGTVESGGQCVACSEGLVCEDLTIRQLPGYWAFWEKNILSVFQCRDQLQCPGGSVGQCAPNRIGLACGSCPEGFAAELDGSCAKCGGRSIWPLVFMLLGVLVIVPAVIAAGIFMTRARRAALSIFMVSIIFGQVVVCLQGLDAIYQLDIRWVDPAKAILQSLAIFSLDLDFSCFLPPQEYILEYAVQLTAYPAVLVVTFLVWLLMRWRRPVSFNAFVNVHGLLLVALLTAITLTLVRPLQCRSNPNGLFTIVSKPYIICWQGEHGTLVMLTVSGILAYPVTILAAITYLTRQYPIWLRSGGGIEVMERYRFLFARFRPERYYYGLILTAHNLLVAIIPAALVALPALQVGIMGIVICLKLIVQILLWPWRLDLANYNDLALSAGLLILLLLASPLLNISQEETLSFVAILLSCVMVLLPLVAVLAASAVVFTRLRPQSKYDAFLCHHKAGAGALCRFFKLVAKKYMKINIFLDSDELDDLGRIFDVVRADVKCLVVVLTTELLHRMWCAGEITTAHKNDVRIIPLYCDGYAFPTNESIDVIESVWTEEQRSTLVSYGISMEDVKEAYLDVQKLKGVALCRSWALEEQEEKILEIISESSRFCSPLSRHKVPRGSIEGAKILVCTSLLPEATSTGMILQQMVQLRMRTSTYSLHTAEDLLPANASFVLFVLSKGVLEDPHFARCLLTSRQKSLEFITVNDGTFQFPQPDFATEVETGRHLLPGLSPNVGPLLAKAYQVLLSILALPLTPHGSSGLLERQVAQICQRLGTLEDGPRKKDGLSSQLGDASFAFESEVSEGKALDRSEVVERESVRSTCSVNSDELWHV